MKILGLVSALALFACNNSGLDNGPGSDAGNGGDGGVQDLSVTPGNVDLSVPGGPVGATCMTACDCQPGLACDPRNNTCAMPPMQIGPVYCCDDTANCPSGGTCQSSSGQYGQCGGMMGGTCTTACDCTPGEACLMGTCRMGFQPVYCCDDPSTCTTGSFCESASGMFGRCGGGTFDLGFPPPGDGGAACGSIPCMRNRTCRNAGCGSCNFTTGFCQ
jgi:hypothetical protein